MDELGEVDELDEMDASLLGKVDAIHQGEMDAHLLDGLDVCQILLIYI
jgi:hypothetical protein